MFGLQTLSCLHDIPVIRSSTDTLQDVYAKAKDTSALVRIPCNVAETVASTSVKVALKVVNPFVKPFLGPVRVLDDYAVQKLRQMENKYPVISTRPEDVLNTFNEKTEPVRNVMNSVKDSTTSTIQHGRETVTNVASGVADSVFSFCGTQASGQPQGLSGCAFSTIRLLFNTTYETAQTSLLWFRMLIVFVLLKVKQVNDQVLKTVQYNSYVPVLLQRSLIALGSVLEYVERQVRLDDLSSAKLKKPKQQSRLNQQQQQQYYNQNRQNIRTNPSVSTRQSVVVTQQETVVRRSNNTNQSAQVQPDYSNLTDAEELRARLANSDLTQSTYNVEDGVFTTTDSVDVVSDADIAQLHARLHPTDVELLYSRLPDDIVPEIDDQGPLTRDQQQLHARIIASELENQGYSTNAN